MRSSRFFLPLLLLIFSVTLLSPPLFTVIFCVKALSYTDLTDRVPPRGAKKVLEKILNVSVGSGSPLEEDFGKILTYRESAHVPIFPLCLNLSKLLAKVLRRTSPWYASARPRNNSRSGVPSMSFLITLSRFPPSPP